MRAGIYERDDNVTGQRALHGVYGSLAGGLVFGLMMQMMGSIGMIAMMVGSESVAVGWIVHLLISAAFGAAYPVLFASLRPQWGSGLLYGLIWYVLGPLTLMPLAMGMGLQWSGAGIAGSIPSLIGHLIWGVILGLVFERLEQRSGSPAGSAGQRAAR
jgi:uncharacterized membrane protein YagU involved in acid resistance